jgi:hypothetical protein
MLVLFLREGEWKESDKKKMNETSIAYDNGSSSSNNSNNNGLFIGENVLNHGCNVCKECLWYVQATEIQMNHIGISLKQVA